MGEKRENIIHAHKEKCRKVLHLDYETLNDILYVLFYCYRKNRVERN